MPFTISREASSSEPAYSEEDARLVGLELLKRGIPLDRVPRVRDRQGQNAWLYVWPSREDAENAAKQLKRRTGDRWVVHENRQQPSVGPLLWLRINLTEESDALLFVLDTVTQGMVEQRFPGSCRHRSVLVGTEQGDDLSKDEPHFLAVARQVLYMLTWVPLDELAVFGRFEVVEPWRRGVVLPSSPIVAEEVGREVASEPTKAVHGYTPFPRREETADSGSRATEHGPLSMGH